MLGVGWFKGSYYQAQSFDVKPLQLKTAPRIWIGQLCSRVHPRKLGLKRCGNERQSWASHFAKIQVASMEESLGKENCGKEKCGGEETCKFHTRL
jgi:hypothetical protein